MDSVLIIEWIPRFKAANEVSKDNMLIYCRGSFMPGMTKQKNNIGGEVKDYI